MLPDGVPESRAPSEAENLAPVVGDAPPAPDVVPPRRPGLAAAALARFGSLTLLLSALPILHTAILLVFNLVSPNDGAASRATIAWNALRVLLTELSVASIFGLALASTVVPDAVARARVSAALHWFVALPLGFVAALAAIKLGSLGAGAAVSAIWSNDDEPLQKVLRFAPDKFVLPFAVPFGVAGFARHRTKNIGLQILICLSMTVVAVIGLFAVECLLMPDTPDLGEQFSQLGSQLLLLLACALAVKGSLFLPPILALGDAIARRWLSKGS
jgi:hypothetical protein